MTNYHCYVNIGGELFKETNDTYFFLPNGDNRLENMVAIPKIISSWDSKLKLMSLPEHLARELGLA